MIAEPATAQLKGQIPYVDYDENGNPVWCTTEEIFDAFDKKLIAHFGEDFRNVVNKSRTEWNKRGPWKFDIL